MGIVFCNENLSDRIHKKTYNIIEYKVTKVKESLLGRMF